MQLTLCVNLWYNFFMNTCEIKIVLEDGAELPSYQTPGAAGCDVRAFLPDSEVVVEAGGRKIIPTGIKMAIPDGFEVQVRPRSGLAAKNGVTVLNTPGTVDSDYRGELKIILVNLGTEDFTVKNGDRIAQFVVAPVTRGVFAPVCELDSTERGGGGFGHTGK